MSQVSPVMSPYIYSLFCPMLPVDYMSQVLRERAIDMLTAGMSTRAVASELNVISLTTYIVDPGTTF